MNKPKVSFYTTADALARMKKIGERLGDMTPNTLASMLFAEFSHVRPEAFFEVVGSNPGRFKD